MAPRHTPRSTLAGTTLTPALVSYLSALEHLAPGAIRCSRQEIPAGKALWVKDSASVLIPLPDEKIAVLVSLEEPAPPKKPGVKAIPFWRKPAIVRMFGAMHQNLAGARPLHQWPESVEWVWSQIVSHTDEALSLDRLAKSLQLSPGHLGMRITNCLGCEFRLLLRDERVAAAALQLTKTNLAVAEICANVSGQSLSQFNRAFLAATGLSPKHYRRMANGGRTARWKSTGKSP
jgi:AraC-like DNA-binding protein